MLGDVGYGNFKKTVSEEDDEKKGSRGREVNEYVRVSVEMQK